MCTEEEDVTIENGRVANNGVRMRGMYEVREM